MAAYDLKIALQKVQQKRQNFVLFRGEEGDQVLITPGAPAPRQINEVENETGEGKRVLKGICYRAETGLVFATRSAGAPAWEKMLSKVFKDRKCSQFLPLSVRQLAPGESEEASEQDETTGANTVVSESSKPTSTQADWERLKSFLMPHLRAGLADPATKDKVLKVVLAAQASEKAGDFAAATAIFQRLAAALSLPLPPPVEIRAPKAGKLQTALNKLAPVLRLAVQSKPQQKAELLQPVVRFQKQLRAGELEEARETLRGLGQQLKVALQPGS